ncbi:MAG TPA: acetate/propionate family kinase [Allosphingosinicella sp.]|nr:acetate/propionate family kinase [Allosphingosinicella sp.]
MSAAVAVLNAGSSSIKFALYAEADDLPLLFRGQIEQIGVAPRLTAKDAAGNPVAEATWPVEGFDHRAATQVVLETARDLLAGAQVKGVGHRVVHGGTDFAEPVRIDAAALTALQKLEPLAPLHQPHNLAPIEAIAEAAPHIAQVACFDTAFHRRQPEIAQMFAIPRRLTEAGVRRYGFHGLSYEYVSGRLAEIAPEIAGGRVIVCHLGNGASLCALRDGASVATTMGFTAVDGLMMGTRCGTIDPGVLIYLMDEEGMDARGIENLVYRQSGLLGVSGISSDMRALRASEEPAAGEAITLFVYRILREIGSLAAALGGLDALVFTGGIGEHDALTRREVAKGCAWLGLNLDAARNAAGEGRISSDDSRLAAWVVPTDEEKMIARHTSALLGLGEPTLPAEAHPAIP